MGAELEEEATISLLIKTTSNLTNITITSIWVGAEKPRASIRKETIIRSRMGRVIKI